MSGFQLRCIAGDLFGQSFPAEGAPRLIGRSRRADIRSQLPDVSAIHALLSVRSGVPYIEVVSVRTTMLNGRKLRQGDILPLSVGDMLKMGGTLAFEVVGPAPVAADETATQGADAMATLAGAPTLADATVPIGVAAPAVTLSSATASPPVSVSCCQETPSDDRTAFFDPSERTRAVTPEELRLLAERQAVRRRNRLRRRGFLLLAVAVIGVVFLLKALWKDTSLLPPVTQVAFVLPDCGPGTYRRDVSVKGVPLCIALEVADSPEELRRSRAASMRAWFDDRQRGGHVYEIDERWRREEAKILTQRYAMPEQDEIYVEDYQLRSNLGHGLPGVCLRYIHTEPTGSRWAGSAVLVRHGERRWVLVREVPWEVRDRATRLLFSTSPYFVAWRAGENPAEAVDRIWDFTPGLPSPKNALGEAVIAERLKHPDTADWPRMDASLAAHLCATRAGSPERGHWEGILAEFRAMQRRWVANHPLTHSEKKRAFPYPERDTRAIGRSVR